MKDKVVSVIVPVYKSEKYLSKCLDSIIKQTYTNLEIILVDDGSPDNSGKICDEYAENDSRVTVIHKTNGGVSSARNAGMEKATGYYISFVDSDDTIDLKYIEKLVIAITSSNIDIAACDFRYTFDCPNQSLTYFVVKKHINNRIISFTQALNELLYQKGSWNFCWGKLFKKAVVNNISFESHTLSEDTLFMVNILTHNGCILHIREKLYNYYQNPDSAIHTNNSHYFIGNYIVSKIICKIVAEKQPSLHHAADCLLISNAFYSFLRLGKDNVSLKHKNDCFDTIKRLRNRVLLDINAPLKTKCACILSHINMSLLQQIYNLFFNRSA